MTILKHRSKLPDENKLLRSHQDHAIEFTKGFRECLPTSIGFHSLLWNEDDKDEELPIIPIGKYNNFQYLSSTEDLNIAKFTIQIDDSKFTKAIIAWAIEYWKVE